MPWPLSCPFPPLAITPPPAPPAEDTSSAGFWFLTVLFAALWVIAWRISQHRHPYKACPRCSGSGKQYGTWFTKSFRACDRCGGVGREYRAFARAPYKQNEHKRRGRR
ncbi:hypothetical protein ACSNOI_43405 [Actinomadura kijaniata]|uniref:hypothetical protein n=1 Tax=Actinomadura kijaniata TaxID=46161 RepID=UPI003F1B5CAC